MLPVKIKEIFAIGNSGEALESIDVPEEFDESIFEKKTPELREYFKNEYGEFKQIIRFKDKQFYLDFTRGKHIFFELTEGLIPENLAKTYIRGETAKERVDKVCLHLKQMIQELQNSHEPGQITRLITPEFSFYTYQTPFTVQEYIQIAQFIADEFKDLDPDIHAVFSSFPVLWEDNTLHNSIIYACSPLSPEQEPYLYHMTKINPSPVDFSYQQPDGRIYPYGSSLVTAMPPVQVLAKSPFKLDAPEQYQGVLQLHSSSGETWVNVIGICFDHALDVERMQVHQFIEQLLDAEQMPALYLSHVLSSASITSYTENFLSETVHVDSSVFVRKHPKKNAMVKSEPFETNFSSIMYESYPAFPVSVMHSDILQHALARLTLSEKYELLNAVDEQGNTILDRVLEESDVLLMAKRVYSLILHGAELSERGHSLLLEMTPDRRYYISQVIDAAISWTLQYNLQMTYQDEHGLNPLTSLLMNIKSSSFSINDINRLILAGYSPFHLDAKQKSLFTEILKVDNKFRQDILTCVKQVQHGLLSTALNYDIWQISQSRQSLFFQSKLPLVEEGPETTLIKSVKSYTAAESSESSKLYALNIIILEFKKLTPPEQNINFEKVIRKFFSDYLIQNRIYMPSEIQTFWEEKYLESYKQFPQEFVFDKGQFWTMFELAPESLKPMIYARFRREILEAIYSDSVAQLTEEWLSPDNLVDFKQFILTQVDYFDSLNKFSSVLGFLNPSQRAELFDKIKHLLRFEDINTQINEKLNEAEKQYFKDKISETDISTRTAVQIISNLYSMDLEFSKLLISRLDALFFQKYTFREIKGVFNLNIELIQLMWPLLQDIIMVTPLKDLNRYKADTPAFSWLMMKRLYGISKEILTDIKDSAMIGYISASLSDAEIEPQDVAAWIMSMDDETVQVFRERFLIEDNEDNQAYYQSIYDLLSPGYQAQFKPPLLSSPRPS